MATWVRQRLKQIDALISPHFLDISARSSKVDFADIRRTPSFHEKSKNGTEVTEYRDRGKPVEIDVKSNFGTRYQMSSTLDTSPKPHDAGVPITRLPSVNLRY